MGTACTIVGVVVTCLMAPGPRPTPAEAAAALEPGAYRPPAYAGSPVGQEAPGPAVVVVAGRPGEGPWGPLTVAPPARRLDGSPLASPPWVAYHPLWWPGGGCRGCAAPPTRR